MNSSRFPSCQPTPNRGPTAATEHHSADCDNCTRNDRHSCHSDNAHRRIDSQLHTDTTSGIAMSRDPARRVLPSCSCIQVRRVRWTFSFLECVALSHPPIRAARRFRWSRSNAQDTVPSDGAARRPRCPRR